MLGTNADTETPDQALRERKQFARYRKVQPGYGNGRNNPLYLQNQAWDRDVRGIIGPVDLTTPSGQAVQFTPYPYGVSDLRKYQVSDIQTDTISSPMVQNYYGLPVRYMQMPSAPHQAGSFAVPTQFVRMPGDFSPSVQPNPTLDATTGLPTHTIPGLNRIQAQQAPFRQVAQQSNSIKNTMDTRYPVNLVRPVNDQRTKWLYSNSTIEPTAGMGWNRAPRVQGPASRPSAAFDTGVFQTGLVRSATSYQH